MTVRTWVGAEGAAETRITVRPKRLLRAQFVTQLYQHVPAVVTVLAAGVAGLGSEREGGALALAAAELLVAAWVLATIVLEARHLFGREGSRGARGAHGAPRAHATSRVDGPGLAAAALGYVEVWHHARETGHFKLVSPLMLSATVTLLFAFGGRRWIQQRFRRRGPHLLVTSDGVSYRGGRRRRWAAAWEDVEGLEHGAGHVTVRLRAGRAHVLRGDDHFGGDALLEEAWAAVARHAPARLTAKPGQRRLSRS